MVVTVAPSDCASLMSVSRAAEGAGPLEVVPSRSSRSVEPAMPTTTTAAAATATSTALEVRRNAGGTTASE